MKQYKKTENVAAHSNQIHVVPSGGYQPAMINKSSTRDDIIFALKDKEDLMATTFQKIQRPHPVYKHYLKALLIISIVYKNCYRIYLY